MKITIELTDEQVENIKTQLSNPVLFQIEQSLPKMPRMYESSKNFLKDLYLEYGHKRFNTSSKRSNELKHKNLISSTGELIHKMQEAGFIKIESCSRGKGIECIFIHKPY